MYFKNDNDLVNNITRLTNIIADKDSSIFREFNSKYAEDVNDIFVKFYREEWGKMRSFKIEKEKEYLCKIIPYMNDKNP